jgi:hypothetical protein
MTESSEILSETDDSGDIGIVNKLWDSYYDSQLFEINSKRIFSYLDLEPVEENLGFSLGMHMDDVITLLGEPIQIETYYSDAYGATQVMFYHDYELCFLDENEYYDLVWIDIINEKISGPRYTYVGDAFESVIAKFPQDVPNRKTDMLFLYDGSWGNTDGFMVFDEKGNEKAACYEFTVPYEYQHEIGLTGWRLKYTIESSIITKISFGLDALY